MRKVIGTAALAAVMMGGALAGAGTAAAAAPVPRLRGCNESSLVRPTWFNPICNDGSYTVQSLHWAEWSAAANGSGQFYTHKGDYPINVMAWRWHRCNYTRFRYQFTRHVPAGFPRSWTIRYYSGRWHGLVV
ncbi:MAG TPA: hypothetical protein VGS19_25080 [Streptosporangiaceae bacterium]|nr:hypothetical protein [Streptosporangiaceae bacterium]